MPKNTRASFFGLRPGQKQGKLSILVPQLFDQAKENIEDIILNINVNKVAPKAGIPAKILKINYDIFAPILCEDFNKGIDNSNFLNYLKCAEIKPTFKKDDRTEKENYRPVSLLPVVSKIYEKVLYRKIDAYFNQTLSPI